MKPIRLTGRGKWAINDGISFCEFRRSLDSRDRMPKQKGAKHVNFIPAQGLVHRREQRLVKKEKESGRELQEKDCGHKRGARDVEE